MKPYLDLLKKILEEGSWQDNRTGIRTKMIPGAMIKFDLRNGFPAVTTKKLAYRSVVGELIGFIRGECWRDSFNDLGCKVWDANSKAEKWLNSTHYKNKMEMQPQSEECGYLGRIYGVQWRHWLRSDSSPIEPRYLDQIKRLIETINTDPTSRRMIVSAWRPDELETMCLPPCHYAFQVIIEQNTRTMHLLWNQRSVDTFLGLPFNIASYATLLHILARITGYNVGTLTGFLADVHIYENHLEQVQEQLGREPYTLPELSISTRVTVGYDIDLITPEDIQLINYYSHPPINAEMAL